MSAAIFNRADFAHPADGWYQIEPKGTHPNDQAGVIQVIDDSACAAMVNRFNADAGAGTLRQGNELLIDHEHFKDQADQETVAYGWLQRLQNRTDGIYGQIRWTATGQAAVDGGEYRFFSTEYTPEDLVSLGGNPLRVRPMRLDGISLTNMPNNRGGKPITNRAISGQGQPTQRADSRDAQHAAARRIMAGAIAEQGIAEGSLASCCLRVMNREKMICGLALGSPVSTGAKVGAREVLEDAATFAGRSIFRLAQSRRLPGLSVNISYIKNRFPRLARMENRKAGWEVLTELEPVARQAYMDVVQGPREDAQPDSRWRGFFALFDTLAMEFPDLGYEGRWQKMKELYPATFLKFVLSFDDREGSADMPAPAPQTERERFQEKIARIAQAAGTEARRYGGNGSGTE